MLTQQEKKLVKEYATKLIKRRKLNEAFQSKLMKRILTLKIPEMKWGNFSGPKTGSEGNIMNYLRVLGVKPSEITDDQIAVGENGGVKYSKDNSNSIVLIYNESTNDLVNIVVDGKNSKVYARRDMYNNSLDLTDPKFKRNSTATYITGRASFGGSSKDDKTGMSNIRSMTVGEMNSYPFYAINVKADPTTKTVNTDFSKSMETNYKLLDKKKSEYKRKIMDIRSAARADAKYPDELTNGANKLEEIGDLLTDLFERVKKNPVKYAYSTLGRTITYGSGSNTKSYYTDFLSMYVKVAQILEDSAALYTKGSNFSTEMTRFNADTTDLIKRLQQALK